MKTYGLDVTFCETLHVQHTNRSTVTTLDLKSRNFKVVLKLLFRHTIESMPNAARALLIRFSMSISIPPPVATTLPRYVKRKQFNRVVRTKRSSKSVLVYTHHSLDKTIARNYSMYGCAAKYCIVLYAEEGAIEYSAWRKPMHVCLIIRQLLANRYHTSGRVSTWNAFVFLRLSPQTPKPSNRISSVW